MWSRWRFRRHLLPESSRALRSGARSARLLGGHRAAGYRSARRSLSLAGWQHRTDSLFFAVGPGLYVGQVANQCGQARDSLTLLTYPAPSPFDLGPDTVLCPGQQLWLSEPQSELRYLWQDGSQADSLLVTQSGTYWLTLSDSCGQVLQSDSILVQFLSPPEAVDLGPDTSLCLGQTQLLHASQSEASYLWSDGSQEATLVAAAPDTFWVRVFNQCGTASDTMVIDALLPPRAVNLGPDTSFCERSQLWLADPQPGMVYLWSDGSTSDSLLITTPGSYSLRVSNRFGERRDSIRLTSQQPPAPIDLGADTTRCAGEVWSVDLPRLQGETFRWQDGTGGNQYSSAGGGTFWVVATNVCGQASDTLTIAELPTPQPFDLGTQLALCLGDSLRLGPDPIPQIEYRWQDGLPFAQRWVRDTGFYRLVAENRCGRAEDDVQIAWLPAPAVHLPDDSQLCVGQVLDLDVGDPNLDTYLWSTGHPGPSLQLRRSGGYFVIGSNACGADTAYLEVAFDDCDCEIFLASAFTPNGDESNDRFEPQYACEPEIISFAVFNRWGQRVWFSDQGQAWDGNYRGRPVPAGVYVWSLRYRWLANQTTVTRQLSGSVTVLR